MPLPSASQTAGRLFFGEHLGLVLPARKVQVGRVLLLCRSVVAEFVACRHRESAQSDIHLRFREETAGTHGTLTPTPTLKALSEF